MRTPGDRSRDRFDGFKKRIGLHSIEAGSACFTP
jgi:hypothetical protein